MFRFTIRDVLWLVLVVAIALMWGLERNRLRETASHLKHVIREYEAEKRDVETVKAALGRRLSELDANAADFETFQAERMKRFRESSR